VMYAAGELRKLTLPAEARRAGILRIKFLSCKRILAADAPPAGGPTS
jgi:hypothetical protein